MAKKKGKGRFFKRNKIALIVVFILLSYLSMTLIKQEIKLNELRQEEKQVLAKIQSLELERDKVESEIEESNNLGFIEKVAREKLKMVKPNEIIYVIQDEKEEDKEDKE